MTENANVYLLIKFIYKAKIMGFSVDTSSWIEVFMCFIVFVIILYIPPQIQRVLWCFKASLWGAELFVICRDIQQAETMGIDREKREGNQNI